MQIDITQLYDVKAFTKNIKTPPDKVFTPHVISQIKKIEARISKGLTSSEEEKLGLVGY